MNFLKEKEQRKYFIQNALSFGVVFFVLGLILFSVIQSTAYSNVDQQLKRIANASSVVIQGENGQAILPPKKDGNTVEFRQAPSMNLQTQLVFWADDTAYPVGMRDSSQLYVLEQLKFSQLHLRSIQSIELNDQNGDNVEYRSYLFKVSKNNSDFDYAQVITNTTQIRQSTTHTLEIVGVCLFVFYLLSLIVSYYLARLQVKPILQSIRKQQDFVENASHELRTPLAIIQNKMELLFQKPNATILESSEEISDSLSELRRLRYLTDDLLTLTREENSSVIEKENFVLFDCLEKIKNDYSLVAEEQGKTFSFEFVGDKEASIDFDRKKLVQLVIILLDNAIKYTKEGEKITLVAKNSSELILQVKDTGIGISNGEKAEIFDRFVRGDKSRSKDTGGFGLGLSIAKQIVTTLQGNLTVTDNFPKGSVFTIRFKN